MTTGWRHKNPGKTRLTLWNSSVNRKDVPAAMDEKQLIDIAVPNTEFEVQRVTLTGVNLTGSFRLSLGGKSTRAIPVDADAAEV